MENKLYVKKQLQEQLEVLVSVQNDINKVLNDLEYFLISTINLIDEHKDFKLEKAVETRDLVRIYLLSLKNVRLKYNKI